METKYLLAYAQPGGKGRRYIEALALDAYYPDRTRVSGRPLAGVTLRESTGKPDLGRLRLMAMVPSRSGGMMGTGTSVIVPNSATGARKAIRAVRPQEHALLEAIDRQLAELKERRREVLALAWRRGHHVAVGELRARADGYRQLKDGV